MSSSRSLSGDLCLYSLLLDRRFQLESFWLPVLLERPMLARRLEVVLSSSTSSTELLWPASCRRFSRFRAQGPSFCQFTRWKAMMQCRLPPTWEKLSEFIFWQRHFNIYSATNEYIKRTALLKIWNMFCSQCFFLRQVPRKSALILLKHNLVDKGKQ